MTDYLPHGVCYLWDPALVGLMVAFDLAIAAAYVLIPMSLWRTARALKAAGLPYFMHALFCLFILGCGATHVLDAISVFTPLYRADLWVSGLTAGVSLLTAFLLFRYVRLMSALATVESVRATLARPGDSTGRIAELRAIYERQTGESIDE